MEERRPPERQVDDPAPDDGTAGNAAAGTHSSGDAYDVLQVGKYYHPQVGGVERVVRQLAEGLAERGHRSRVLVTQDRGRGERGSVDGVPVWRVGSLGSVLSVPAAPSFPPALYRARREADVIHYHLPNPLAVAAHLLLPEPAAAVVVTYHSDIVRQSTALRLYRPVLQRFLHRADRVLVTSPALRDSEHLAAVRERTQVVPLTVSLDEADATQATTAPDEPDRRLAGGGGESDDSVDTDRPTVLFVGRLSYYKGVETLVEAMASVNARLIVVGDGERREAVQERVSALGIDDRVHMLGRVAEAQLQRLYDTAHVFVLPSVAESEAFGIVQLEAMAHGTPVVNTDLPTGVPWVSRDGETGLTVTPGDSEALADAVRALLTDEELRRRYGRNARRRVEEQFAEPQMLDAVEATYDELVSDTDGGSETRRS